MKRFFAALVVVALVTLTHAALASNLWLSSGEVSNPSAGTVLVDSGPISAPSGPIQLSLCWSVYATALTTVSLQHRNAANTGDVQDQVIGILANSNDDFCEPVSWDIADQERIRLVARTGPGLLGTVSASLWTADPPKPPPTPTPCPCKQDCGK